MAKDNGLDFILVGTKHAIPNGEHLSIVLVDVLRWSSGVVHAMGRRGHEEVRDVVHIGNEASVSEETIYLLHGEDDDVQLRRAEQSKWGIEGSRGDPLQSALGEIHTDDDWSRGRKRWRASQGKNRTSG